MNYDKRPTRLPALDWPHHIMEAEFWAIVDHMEES